MKIPESWLCYPPTARLLRAGNIDRIKLMEVIFGLIQDRNIKYPDAPTFNCLPRISCGPTKALICLCPFHFERTPSFRMWQNGGYHCFGCLRQGSIVDLIDIAFGPLSEAIFTHLLHQFIRLEDDPNQLIFEFARREVIVRPE